MATIVNRVAGAVPALAPGLFCTVGPGTGGQPGVSPGTFFLNVTNKASTDQAVSIAITDGAPPADADWINWNEPVLASRTFGRWPLPLRTGQQVWVVSPGSSLVMQLFALERA